MFYDRVNAFTTVAGILHYMFCKQHYANRKNVLPLSYIFWVAWHIKPKFNIAVTFSIEE